MSAHRPDPELRIRRVAQAFFARLRFPHFLNALFLALGVLLLGAWLARQGSDQARLLSALLMGLSFSLLLAIGSLLRRRSARVEYGIVRALKHLGSETSGRILRAYGLWKKSQAHSSTGGAEQLASSVELSELHLTRLLDALDEQKLQQAAAKERRWRMLSAAALAIVSFFFLLSRPLAFVEGLDVLFARNGVGPVPLAYVHSLQTTAEWPSYLDGTGKKHYLQSEMSAVPVGAELEVHVQPLVQDRQLLLTDGNQEVPLLSDGQGGLVARWKAENPTGLRVAARFGDVLLLDIHQTQVEPLEDRAPEVVLMGAPQEMPLEELETLELAYVASDDHGLSQVELVLQSGQRNVRTELAHLDSQTRLFHGGHTITREHEMLRRAFLPVRIRIEARDGNTATGPNWGKSAEIVLLPEALGKEVAERHIALRSFRKALSSYLAEDMQSVHATHQKAVEARAVAHQELNAAFEVLEKELSRRGPAPRSTISFIRAQVEALGREGKERATPESVLLAVDALIHSSSQKEAIELSKNLGQSVEEIAVQARQLRFEAAALSREGLKDLVRGTQLGATQLREVGSLGLDLGSVAQADLLRIEKSLKLRAFERAEAAALHLAERLKRATPSFSSKGGAAVESGTPSSGGSGRGSGDAASSAPSEFQELAQELDSLAQEHAQELSELEQLLQQAEQAARADFEVGEEFEESLSELRDALDQLPSMGRGPGTASSEAASARSQGQAMADAAESGDFEEAVERALDTKASLERAADLLNQGRGWLDPQIIERAQKALEGVLKEARSAAQKMKEASQVPDSQQLRERAERQRAFAERARQLAEKGKEPGSPLPQQNLESLKRAARLLEQAARAIENHEGERSQDYASEAQDELERAQPTRSESDSSEGDGEGEGEQSSTKGRVPEEERDRARDFRDRVEKGLGRKSGRLSPAVRRYAEDLK